MLQLKSCAVARTTTFGAGMVPRKLHRVRTLRPVAASETESSASLPVAVAGLISNPIMLFSEYTLKTTGEGVPPGPGGIFGALEGISYLVVLGIVAWSLKTKLSTGSGLPAGPSGLLGAAEGLSYLSLLGGIVVFALTFLEKGSLPGPLGY